jgi:hypothetical protein
MAEHGIIKATPFFYCAYYGLMMEDTVKDHGGTLPLKQAGGLPVNPGQGRRNF